MKDKDTNRADESRLTKECYAEALASIGRAQKELLFALAAVGRVEAIRFKNTDWQRGVQMEPREFRLRDALRATEASRDELSVVLGLR